MDPKILDFHKTIPLSEFSELIQETPPYMKHMLEMIESNNNRVVTMMHPRRGGKSILASALRATATEAAVSEHVRNLSESLNKQILRTMEEAMCNMVNPMRVSVANDTITYDEFSKMQALETFEERYTNDKEALAMAIEPIRPIRRVKTVKPDGRVIETWES